jgi:hypothetical protein
MMLLSPNKDERQGGRHRLAFDCDAIHRDGGQRMVRALTTVPAASSF